MQYITHEYVRVKLSSGGYDVNNPARLDGEGNPILLAKEIEAAYPGRKFLVRCDDIKLCVLVDDQNDFTPAEKTALDQLIADHKANV